ncbi:hypothetical protein K469DRAFT_607621 [Zopfia rhizophila CBS 207.26]|uniref:ARID domain-containing protein n=1 Tax=Zopfia rhizophila CBS 207.26 TaxID=1314779 RepID=A0A6A6DD95_9PEZI|nr:hypothetical protein K469DRAFT_607621 [Zopfia rhizophila CBS 207.26]
MFNNSLPDAESNFIDPSMFGNNPRLQNGAARNPYPVNSMVPSKRPREDSTGASLSRSQTPAQQQGQFGFQGNQHSGPQPLQVPSPFSHLQSSAANTPSPTLQNQNFRPGAVPPQRMQTVSPAQNPNGPQMSPMNFMQGSPMPQGYNQNFGNQFQVQPVQLSHNLQSRQQEAQRQYTMRLQAQQHQLGSLAASNMAAQQRHQAGQMLGSTTQHPGMQRSMNPVQVQNQQAQARQSMENFLKNVSALMAQLGQQFNPQPHIAGRPINLQQLYYAVMKLKGSKYITQTGSWPRVAQMMGLDPRQLPTVAEELRVTYEQNLGPYEAAYLAKQQQMKSMNPQQAQMGGMGSAPQFGQQMSPTKPMPQGTQNNMSAQQQYLQQLQRTQAMQQQQIEHSTPIKNNAAMANVNGWSTPQLDGKMPANALGQHRKSLSRQLEATPPQGQGPGFPSPSPGPDKMRESVPPSVPPTTNGVVKVPNNDVDKDVYVPYERILESWGGLDVKAPGLLDKVERDRIMTTMNVPALGEMGVIDIRALTMSIQSGLHREVRLALDVLSKLSHEQQVTLELEKCEDLIDVLVECAEDQLDALSEENPEVSDILDLTPYEDVIRNCRAEVESVQDIPEFGTKAYDLDRTADRLIAITTILRNLSFFEFNHSLLASPPVLKFLSNAIRLVGTRVLLLRSHINTADFMKDLITFFSNTSDKIVLPSREEAYAILQFLCSFAPCPRPGTPVKFTSYNPQIHRYLPPAVDSLAKLLARDDPNRTYYKHVFAAEATSTPPYDLLTRAFALAISVVPDRAARPLRSIDEKRIAEARKPYLMQGMLAGDILASLAPGPDSGVCRSWLEAEDGWAASLLRFAVFLCGNDARPPPPPQGGRPHQRLEQDTHGFQLIIHRALSMLKRLGEKSKGGEVLVKGEQTNGHAEHDEDEDDNMEMIIGGGSKWRVKADVLPKKEMLLGALLTANIDPFALRQLCNFGNLDDF